MGTSAAERSQRKGREQGIGEGQLCIRQVRTILTAAVRSTSRCVAVEEWETDD